MHLILTFRFLFNPTRTRSFTSVCLSLLIMPLLIEIHGNIFELLSDAGLIEHQAIATVTWTHLHS